MITIEIAYSCSTIIALLASASQVKQLLISKRSDELSPATWSVWSCTQFVSLLYALSLEQAVNDSRLLGINTVGKGGKREAEREIMRKWERYGAQQAGHAWADFLPSE